MGTGLQDCQGDLEIREEKLSGYGVGFHRYSDTVRLQAAPGGNEVATCGMRGSKVGFQLGYQFFERRREKFAEDLAVAIGESLAGRILREARRQSFVIVKPGIVVAKRCQVDQTV
jgi:hypothetical protein